MGGSREVDVKLNWLGIAAVAALAGACAELNPPPPAPTASDQPAAMPASADAQSSAAGSSPANPVTFNLPPSAIDTNPPGTPSYVISPGDTVGRRNAQVPRPGGAPAF